MLDLLSVEEVDGFTVKKYTKDGFSVYATVKVQSEQEAEIEPAEPIEHQPTLEEITEENLLETKYQTLLIEMML